MEDRVRILVGDALDTLRSLPDQSVQCCVTSPPYWGLRDYGTNGQLGLEKTPEEYVEKMVAVFREVRRVLRDDGTLWLNLGDSYNGVGRGEKANGLQIAARATAQRTVHGLKPKDLVGIPWRVAFALQQDGWYLRSDIVWSKPNPMPESVTDRPTKSHEYLFLLAKSQRYYFDREAVAEQVAESTTNRVALADGREAKADTQSTGGRTAKRCDSARVSRDTYADERDHLVVRPGINGKRNIRSVWQIATQPFPGAHFAVMPPKLVEPCIKAGSRLEDTVLDPFAGAGTTGLVADRLGRSFLGIELNPAYAEMARQRIHDDAPLLARQRRSDA